MYYVYILESKKDKKMYIGSTNDLKRRLQEHQNGKVQSTSYRRPLELVYFEAFRNEAQARRREMNLKHFGKAYQELKRRIL